MAPVSPEPVGVAPEPSQGGDSVHVPLGLQANGQIRGPFYVRVEAVSWVVPHFVPEANRSR